MSDGERAYRSKCAACHRLYEPGERTKEQWESAVAKMVRLKKVRLTQVDEDLILGYLTGPRPPPVPAAPRAGGPRPGSGSPMGAPRLDPGGPPGEPPGAAAPAAQQR